MTGYQEFDKTRMAGSVSIKAEDLHFSGTKMLEQAQGDYRVLLSQIQVDWSAKQEFKI